jgi:HK97 family phage portal protein
VIVQWPWSAKPEQVEERSYLSISDPALARWLSVGTPNYSGVPMGEGSALAVSAVWRAVSLISQTLASLPVRTIRDVGGVPVPVSSWLDNPCGDVGDTPFEFWERVYVSLLLHGDAFCAHLYNGAGNVAALHLIHPLSVRVEWEKAPNGELTGRKLYTASMVDGRERVFTADRMTHIMGLSLDGLRGVSVVGMAANTFGTAAAGDRAAAKMFSSGALLSGMVTPDEDLDPEDAKTVADDLNRNVSGWDNAGRIAVISRNLKFTPWTMSAADAQFLESRAFQVEEIARWFGVPPHALMQTEKQTSWGTGIESQQRGLARTVLAPWSMRAMQRVSRLLGPGLDARHDFGDLEKATPAEELATTTSLVSAGLITVNEGRARLKMPPIPGGDVLRPLGTTPAATAPDTEDVAA